MDNNFPPMPWYDMIKAPWNDTETDTDTDTENAFKNVEYYENESDLKAFNDKIDAAIQEFKLAFETR